VNYATANGSAVAGSDYTAKSGTLTFTSTQASQSVSVATIDDGLVEATENFSMSLSSPTGGAVLGTPGSAVATINDNDGAGSCSGVSYVIGDAAGTEGDILSFSVTKSGSTSSSCSINYATADGTAIAGTNYLATSGTLTFTAAQTLGTVSVSTIDQSRLVGNKTMFVNLSGATGGAAISDGQGQGSIGPSGGGGGGQCNPVCP
jgi:chitinase